MSKVHTTFPEMMTQAYGGPRIIEKEEIERLKAELGDAFKPENYETDKYPSQHHPSRLYNKVYAEHHLGDGIYNMTDHAYLYISNKSSLDQYVTEEELAFIKDNGGLENIYFGIAYEVIGFFLIAGKPQRLSNLSDENDTICGTIGDGACAVLKATNEVRSFLILAED